MGWWWVKRNSETRLACLRGAHMKLCTARSLVSCPFGAKKDMIRLESRRMESPRMCVGLRGEDVGKIDGGRSMAAQSRDLIIGGGASSAASCLRRVTGIPIQPVTLRCC